ncbi:MAG: hypothetical protein RR275_05380 [Lachnospiraceae bacterium]|jgi:hypothetical protein
MDRKQFLKLKNDLVHYDRNIDEQNNNTLHNAIQIVIESLENQLSKPIQKKENDIITIIKLIENNNIDKIKIDYPKLMYDSLLEATYSKINLDYLHNYTILQLKVLYYLLTKDKDNNAIKTSKKESILNAVKEVVFSNLRAQKFENN